MLLTNSQCIVKLDMITARAVEDLYAPTTVRSSWKAIQSSISELSKDLEIWASNLPSGLQVNNLSQPTAEHHQKERHILAFHYFSAKILISRPCLCRLDRRIKNETQGSADFNRRTAEICVKNAIAVAHTIPDVTDFLHNQIYEIGPWWSMVYDLASTACLKFVLTNDTSRFILSCKVYRFSCLS
jgi:hypothetical protein